jgi:7-cyano-7-deazaguanine synthase
MKVVISLSGGLDSSTLCAYYLENGHEVVLVGFSYGSKHNKYENESAKKVAEFYGLEEPKLFELNFIGKLFRSDLLITGGEIPEGHYTDQSMSATVVPARNLIFASIVAGYAESIGAEVISLGVHGGDHHIYPDCRPQFISALNTAVMLATDGKVRVDAPFLYFTKGDILRTGLGFKKIEIPYHLTRTCYKDQELACGKCGSCVERLEAFAEVGISDPIQYEN